jgi:hypothetical protein
MKKPTTRKRVSPAQTPTGRGDALPTDPGKFWSAMIDLSTLERPRVRDTASALKLLGPLPFPRSGFPLAGVLATLYEQVGAQAKESLPGETGPRP